MSNPWDRRKNERRYAAHAAFMGYCMMGPGRSIQALWKQYRRQSASFEAGEAAAQKPPTRRLRTLFGWSSHNDWPERAEAWDAHMRTKEEDKWAEFLEELRETERRLSQALTGKAEQMLKFPVARVTRQEEAGVTIVEPMDWKLADATRMAAEGSKLGRKAAGVGEDGEGVKVEVTVRTVGGGVVEEL